MNKSRNTQRFDADVDPVAIRPLNARSIALSVLLGSHPPELPVRSFVAMAELFGIPGGTMRTALSRMMSAGEVVAENGHYRLAGRLLDRQEAQDAGRRPPTTVWDGAWHMIVAVDDQRGLTERRQFRAVMANLRYGEFRPDIWIRPSNLERPAARPDWIATTGAVAGIGHDRLVDRLWNLTAIAASARGLLADMDARRDDSDWEDEAAIPDLFTTSAAVVRFLRNEPLLPPELTPVAWPVDDVRATYDEFEADHQRLLQRFLRST